MKRIFLNWFAVLTAATFTTALLLAGCKGAPAAGPRYPNDDEETPRTVRTVAHAAGIIRQDKVAATYLISTEAQLRDFAAEVLAYPDDKVNGILMNDITLTQPWTPIGKDNSGASPKIISYTGTFDGRGYTISGLNVTETTTFAGLFALNNGVIQNLTVEGTVTVTQGANDIDYVAGVVAYNDIAGTGPYVLVAGDYPKLSWEN